MEIKLPYKSPMLDKAFTFGVATSSFQIEGATNVDGRCPSIWDTFCETKRNIRDGSNGSVACDHYSLWEGDIDLIGSLNVDAYRLSFSWPRIIKDRKGTINPAGLKFYSKIINRLLEKGIQPFVTLYHWDLPQYLEDRGGWLNRETAYAFSEYANVVSDYFGDDIAVYSTLNEPWCSSILSYSLGVHAPGYKNRKMAYQAAHHLLLGHGLAMQKLKKNAPQAKHGIVLNFSPAFPATNSFADKQATDLADAEFGHWFIQPLLERKYPQTIMNVFPNDMPLILPGDMDIISEPLDYLGINYYSRQIVKQADVSSSAPYEIVDQVDAEKTDMGWEIYPDGLFHILKSLNETYQLPPVYITENGMACADQVEDGKVNDLQRIEYFQNHLNAVHRAIVDGVIIKGYFAWSLMDNFEWAEGYLKRFGLVYIDYQNQKRILKQSALAFRDFLAKR
jgi:beta-glucosidase